MQIYLNLLNYMYKVLVTGVNGQLGSEIRSVSHNYPFEFIFTDSKNLDITDLEKVTEFLKSNSVNAIINCAAYTAVDRAETDTETADAVNHLAVKNLAKSAKDLSLTFVHVSTDYVFNGESFKPYTEESDCDPQGVYGATKRAGEEALISLQVANSIIIRTSWVYSTFGNNFLKTMIRLGKNRPEINVVVDQVGTPTNARDLAVCILEILPKIATEETQIYHFSNEGVCSWYDFAIAIMELSGSSCQINPIPSSEYPTPTKRPFYSVLSKSKIKSDFGISIPHWRESLEKCIQNLD